MAVIGQQAAQSIVPCRAAVRRITPDATQPPLCLNDTKQWQLKAPLQDFFFVMNILATIPFYHQGTSAFFLCFTIGSRRPPVNYEYPEPAPELLCFASCTSLHPRHGNVLVA
jgi:hypothetical protein